MKAAINGLVRRLGYEVRRVPTPQSRKSSDKLGFFDTPGGKFFLPLDAPDDAIFLCMKEGRVFEPEVIEKAKGYIRPGTVVLDVGSNFGQMAMIFAKEVGRDGEVYAFEAQRSVFDILLKNLAANGVENVRPMFNAVYHESDKTFHFPKPDFARFKAYGSYNLPLSDNVGEEVSTLRIDELQIKKPISFMKVDVQGCDLFAMQGARDTINKHRMPIIFEYEERFQEEYGTTFQDYVEFVRSINYRFAETVLDINYIIVPNN